MKSLTKQLRRLRNDERGVSPVVGFVLIFALIMIVFTLYQSSVVPAQNKEVEFKHSQIVEGEMSELNDAIQQAGASGVPQSVTIDTGVQYPDRALAINPGSPAGTLSTSDTHDVTISGLSDGSGYWSSDDRDPFETRLVNYSSNYNLFQQETTYTLENGMFVKNFESGNTLLESDGSVISDNGKQINLVLVGGDYQKSQMTTSTTVRPVSTSTEYLSLKPDDAGTIEIPTTLTKGRWKGLLDGTNVSHAGKQYANFGGYDGSGDIHTVTINLDSTDETYELRLTKVRFGGSSKSTPKYLKSEDPQYTSETIEVTVDKSETFTVSARDKLGNPVAGAEVTASTDGAERVDGPSETNDNGRATFSYTPGAEDAEMVTIELSIDDGIEDYETVTYELEVSDNSDDENDGDNSLLGSGDITNGYGLEPSTVIIDQATYKQEGKDNLIEFEFSNINEGGPTMKAVEVQINGFMGKKTSPKSGKFNGQSLDINGRNVNLTAEGGDGSDNTFDIPGGEIRTPELTDLEFYSKKGGGKGKDKENINRNGLFLVSVKYRYEYTTDDGKKKTGTDVETYAVAVVEDK